MKSTKNLFEDLLVLLIELRSSEAKKNHVPAFLIFLDVSLEDMARRFPITIEEIGKCKSVTRKNAIKYGMPFAKKIEKYVLDNDIMMENSFDKN